MVLCFMFQFQHITQLLCLLVASFMRFLAAFAWFRRQALLNWRESFVCFGCGMEVLGKISCYLEFCESYDVTADSEMFRFRLRNG